MTDVTNPFLRRLAGAGGDGVHAEELGDRARGAWALNFALQLLARTLSKVGDVLASPRTVLPWLLAAGGAPAWTAGALTPLRESGALLPQAPLGNWMRGFAVRRWFWVVGALLQGVSVASIALIADRLAGQSLGLFAVGVMVVFSLARAMASISSKDILGRTVPRGRRGRLTGTSASVAGALSLAAGAALGFSGLKAAGVDGTDASTVDGVRTLLWIAAIGWGLAALAMAAVREEPAENGGNGSLREGFGLLRRDDAYRRFVITRGLLAGTVLAMPFTVLLTREATGDRLEALGLLVVAAAAARMVSGTVWGRLADRSSRRTLIVAGAAASLVLAAVFVLSQVDLPSTTAMVIWTVLFFLLGLAHTGIRTGRKTYVVDLADDETRPLYVGVANTLMGIVLLGSTALSGLASLWSPSALIVVLAVLGGSGALMALRLPEIDELQRRRTPDAGG